MRITTDTVYLSCKVAVKFKWPISAT